MFKSLSHSLIATVAGTGVALGAGIYAAQGQERNFGGAQSAQAQTTIQIPPMPAKIAAYQKSNTRITVERKKRDAKKILDALKDHAKLLECLDNFAQGKNMITMNVISDGKDADVAFSTMGPIACATSLRQINDATKLGKILIYGNPEVIALPFYIAILGMSEASEGSENLGTFYEKVAAYGRLYMPNLEGMSLNSLAIWEGETKNALTPVTLERKFEGYKRCYQISCQPIEENDPKIEHPVSGDPVVTTQAAMAAISAVIPRLMNTLTPNVDDPRALSLWMFTRERMGSCLQTARQAAKVEPLKNFVPASDLLCAWSTRRDGDSRITTSVIRSDTTKTYSNGAALGNASLRAIVTDKVDEKGPVLQNVAVEMRVPAKEAGYDYVVRVTSGGEGNRTYKDGFFMCKTGSECGVDDVLPRNAPGQTGFFFDAMHPRAVDALEIVKLAHEASNGAERASVAQQNGPQKPAADSTTQKVPNGEPAP